MGMFNNEIKRKKIIKKRPIYYLSAARQITDSGFGNWEIASNVGFNVLRAADGLMIIKILNVCVLHADVDVIKQKRAREEKTYTDIADMYIQMMMIWLKP